MQITVIRHHHNEAELDDNAVRYLQRCGHEIVHRFPFDGDELTLPAQGAPATIILGGGQNVTDLGHHKYLSDEIDWINSCIQNNTPLMGICLGAQLIAHALGATISQRKPRECEYGFYPVMPTEHSGTWLTESQYFMQAHYQEYSLPAGAVQLAYGERFPQQAFRYGQSTYAMQFHPEVNKPIFLDWLADTWSDEMAATCGAQSKAQQNAVAELHLMNSLFDDVKDDPA